MGEQHDGIAEPFGLSVGDGGSGAAVLTLSGDWVLRPGMPRAEEVFGQLKALNARQIVIDAGQLRRWDDALVNYMMRLKEACDAEGLTLDTSGLPEGVRRLVELALAVPERSGASRSVQRVPFFEAVGRNVLAGAKDARNVITFLGDATLMFGRFLSGRAIYQRRDLWLTIEQCGADALPIVTIISLLVGMILGFVGAIQLEQFGAGIYVADLVGIAMVREMGAMMTGIIMAGRTGAAFAAQLGTMKVTQEIDAFTTMGFSPLEFLVLPRVIALVLMMPLLCLYADLVGVLGGAVIGVGMLDLSWITYFRETSNAISLGDVFGGVFKASVYGVLIALSGCLRGIQCGNSSSAVGDAATSAVVTGIVAIVVACGTFAVVFYVLGI